MKRCLWVVERKDGDEWIALLTAVSFGKELTEQLAGTMQRGYTEPKYRASKYIPAE
jgi:hypothetical protein